MKPRIVLDDTTILIPFRGTKIRKRLLHLVLDNLVSNFEVKIIVAEHDKHSVINLNKKRWNNVRHDFIKAKPGELFDRTGTLNYLIKNSDTKIIFNHDSDVILHPGAYRDAIRAIYSEKADFVIPYNGLGWNVKYSFRLNPKTINSRISVDKKHIIGLRWRSACGGIVAANRESYVEAGMENPNIISWGYEDWERIFRFNKLGYKILGGYHTNYHKKNPACRLVTQSSIFRKYDLYHYDHDGDRGRNSSKNPHKQHNINVSNKIKNMSKKQLLKEISRWKV